MTAAAASAKGDLRAASQAALDALVPGPDGVLGAALVSRDGLPVLSRFHRSPNDETFSAMVAAVMGAAEAALQELAMDAPAAVLVESGSLRLTLVALDKDYLLAVAAPAAVPAERLRAIVARAAGELRAILSG